MVCCGVNKSNPIQNQEFTGQWWRVLSLMGRRFEIRLKRMEMTFLRRCCRLTLQDAVKNEIRGRTGITMSIMDTADVKSFCGYGYGVELKKKERNI